MDPMKLVARPALKQRLSILAGSPSRFVVWTRQQLPTEQAKSVEWLRKVLGGHSGTPYGLAIEFIRIAEQEALTLDEAWELRSKWFVEEVE